MARIDVELFVESRYKVNRKRIVKAIADLIRNQSVGQDVVISVAIVGDRKMRALSKKYRNLDKTTNVLSFPIHEGKPMVLPAGSFQLGDVVISYPEVIREAARDEMLVDDRIEELAVHGVTHLLGIHHE